MPRRSGVSPEEVAALDTLAAAFWRAARGRRERPEVIAFASDLDASLRALREEILDGRAPAGVWKEFQIRDPKPRRILAPCFRDRVFHHALMAHAGPVLERALVSDTYACRVGRGSLAAVLRAQALVRRHPWLVKVDVRSYFASIDHAALRGVLARRFKHPGTLALFDAVLARTPDGPGRGLPIGALTSQFFANTYLDALDRHLLETLRVCGMVRYMDDVIWWCPDRATASRTLADVREFLRRSRGLALNAGVRIARSADGVGFLGYRVLPGVLRLSLRRRRRYVRARRRAERGFLAGELDAAGLQRSYDATLAVTAHADARGWRARELLRHPEVDA